MADENTPFTLQVVTQDGQSYYQIESIELKDPKPVTELMQQLVGMKVDMAHQPYADNISVAGTFIVNLAAFAPEE